MQPLRGNDLVRIQHSELKAYLAASLCFEEKTPEIYFRDYLGSHDIEKLNINAIWEILHPNTISQGRPFKAGKQPFLLRHFNSGKLLIVDTVTGKTYLEYVGGEALSPDSPVKNSLRLIELQSKDNFIYFNNTYRIIANKDPLVSEEDQI